MSYFSCQFVTTSTFSSLFKAKNFSMLFSNSLYMWSCVKASIRHAFSSSTSLWSIERLHRLNTFISTVIFLKDNCINLFRQLMRVLVMARKGLPSMIRTEFTPFLNGYVSNTTKYRIIEFINLYQNVFNYIPWHLDWTIWQRECYGSSLKLSQS